MKLYGAIDLHARNNVIVILDETDRILFHKRCPNDLKIILQELAVFKAELSGIAVESTFNWYWLVDGLMEEGYHVHLVNTSAVKSYEGMKYSDDKDDARWLAHLLRLGILPEGYIYPKEERAVRDLLRKRAQLVRQKTAHILSIENLVNRNTGRSISSNAIKKMAIEDINKVIPEPDRALAVKSNLLVMQCLGEQIKHLEKSVRNRVRPSKQFRFLKSVDGIGDTLAMTILMETGDVHRFPEVGNYVSYCRCVDSKRMSNEKKKGKGNRKNGNKFLAWAYMEAAHFAIRGNEKIRQFYARKAAKKNPFVALKAVAHKLARACYYVLLNHESFDVNRAFV